MSKVKRQRFPMAASMLVMDTGRCGNPCRLLSCKLIGPTCVLWYPADDAITPKEVFEVMEKDVGSADLILWVGISFEQSASTEYFRRVRRTLQEVSRLHVCKQAIINPSDEALWNLLSANNNRGNATVLRYAVHVLRRCTWEVSSRAGLLVP